MPATFFVTLLLMIFGVPFWVTYAISRPFMDRLAAQADVEYPPRSFVGLYPVQYIERIGDEIRLRIAAPPLIFEPGGGFTYSPTGPPQWVPARRQKSCGGGWYYWTEDPF